MMIHVQSFPIQNVKQRVQPKVLLYISKLPIAKHFAKDQCLDHDFHIHKTMIFTFTKSCESHL